MLNIQRDFLDNVLQTLLEHHCDVTLTTTLFLSDKWWLICTARICQISKLKLDGPTCLMFLLSLFYLLCTFASAVEI